MINKKQSRKARSLSDYMPMPESAEELVRALFRNADRKLAIKLAEEEKEKRGKNK